MSVDNRDQQYAEAYRMAVSSRQFEGNLIWTRFSGMLTANAILVALTGLALREDRVVFLLLGLVGSLIGIVVAAGWGYLTWRGSSYMNQWREAIKSIENRWFTEPLIRGAIEDIRSNRVPEWQRIHVVQYVVAGAFGLFHVLGFVTFFVLMVCRFMNWIDGLS